MIRPFRLALVGAGMITQQSHLPAALASPLAVVAAIVDPVVGRARQLARSYGITPQIAPRVDDVLSDIDAAVIATPNDTHRDIAIVCLKAGVSTLIEKPLASSYKAGLEIVRAGEEAQRVVAVGYSTRFRQSTVLLKALLDDGYFGTVQRFAHQFGTAGGWAPLSSYNLNRQAAGGGVLVVTGTHFLDRMLYYWGYPDEAFLLDDSRGGPEANCTATFKYRSSPRAFEGVARYSKTARLAGGLVIETSSGSVVVADNDDADIVFRPNSRPGLEETIRSSPGPNVSQPVACFQQQLEDFIIACLEPGRSPRIDGRQGLESMRLIEQLYANREAVSEEPYGRVERRVSH